MTPIEIKKIRSRMRRETSFIPDKWSPSNPSYGQCLPVALTVHEKFGGEVYKVTVKNYAVSHFFNMVNGAKIDLTEDQFNKDPPIYGKPLRLDEDRIAKLKKNKRYQIF